MLPSTQVDSSDNIGFSHGIASFFRIATGVSLILMFTSCETLNKSPKPASPSASPFFARMAGALNRSLKMKVFYHDSLGEGVGMWDSDPLYPEAEVNCETWLNFVLAESFNTDKSKKIKVMNRIRYFNGVVAFGTRKHFVDQWVNIDPGPLEELKEAPCVGVSKTSIELDIDGFASRANYSCPMIYNDRKAFSFNYLLPSEIVKCVKSLDVGYYVIYLVAPDWYITKYGKKSGPISLVHSQIIEITKNEQGTSRKIYNASLKTGRVGIRDIPDEGLKDLNSFKGAKIYKINPSWSWESERKEDLRSQEIQRCELQLVKGGAHRPPTPIEKWEFEREKNLSQ